MNVNGFILSIWDNISNIFSQIATSVINLLPNSPFIMLESNPLIDKYLGYLNYFVPISFFISVIQLWLVAVGIFYLYQIILRWAKAIE